MVGLIVENLAATKSLIARMLDVGTAGTLMTCVFEDLPVLAEPVGTGSIGPVRRTNQGRHDSMSTPVLPSSGSPGGGKGGKTGKAGKKKHKDPVAAHVVRVSKSILAVRRRQIQTHRCLRFFPAT